jgi:DNA polymerase-3 subunit delta'
MATHQKDQVTTPPAAANQDQAAAPRFFRDILGQERVISHLKTAMAKGRLSHAYLFVGPQGVGKASVARALAAALNCAQPRADGDACGECPSCRRLQAGTHPDFLVISPPESKAQIGIGQIRELRRLTEYPPWGAWRVAVIKPAEALTAQNDAAANALLKTLEEPPDRHVLVLTALGEADLLPTVVSRCHKLAFAPLPAPLVAQELVKRRGLPPARAALLAALSGGSWAGPEPGPGGAQRRQVLADLARLAGSAAGVLDWAAPLEIRPGRQFSPDGAALYRTAVATTGLSPLWPIGPGRGWASPGRRDMRPGSEFSARKRPSAPSR